MAGSGDNRDEIISQFFEYVNVSKSELEAWLKTSESKEAGWTGSDGGDGESVGHESGREIVSILSSGTSAADASKFSEDEVAHMKKVNAYCKRHLAQEGKLADSKSEDELKKTKSYRSLKNWGHDLLKAKNGNGSGPQAGDKRSADDAEASDDKDAKKAKADDEEEGDDEEEDEEYEEGDEDDEEGEDGEEGEEDDEEEEYEEEDDEEGDDDEEEEGENGKDD
ncbi:hypothetical protein PYCC9005_001833 [Savitreella phatthalungensis]